MNTIVGRITRNAEINTLKITSKLSIFQLSSMTATKPNRASAKNKKLITFSEEIEGDLLF